MALPPLQNLRFGASTGVALTFSKNKTEDEQFENDEITTKEIDDYIDKESALAQLEKLISNLTNNAEFLMRWRMAICSNMTQKLSLYNGQTEGIIDDIFKEQNLLLRLIDAFRRPVELVKGEGRNLTNDEILKMKGDKNKLWNEIKAGIPRYLDTDGGYDVKDAESGDTPLSRKDRLQNRALMDMNESKHSMLGDSTKRFKLLNMKVEAIKKLTDEIQKRVEVIAYNEKWAQAAADFINSLKELKDYPEQAGMAEKIVNVVNAFIKNPSVAAHQFNNVMIMGGAGTGKTRLAGILGRIFSQLGMYVYDEVVEASVGDFIAGFEGQTEEKVVTFLTTNAEKIIFLDEAYALTKWDDKHEHLSGYATEAVAELIAFLSKNVGRMGFMAAGYEDKMNDDFLEANEGFERRFPIRVTLQRYENKTLFHIFIRSLALSFVGPEPSATERDLRSDWKRKLHEKTAQCYGWFMDEAVHLLFDLLDASLLKKPTKMQDLQVNTQGLQSVPPSQSTAPSATPSATLQVTYMDMPMENVVEPMDAGSFFSGSPNSQAPMFRLESISMQASDLQPDEAKRRQELLREIDEKVTANKQKYEGQMKNVPDELLALIRERATLEVQLKFREQGNGEFKTGEKQKLKNSITKAQKLEEVFVLKTKTRQLEELQAQYYETQQESVKEIEKMKKYLNNKLLQWEQWEYDKVAGAQINDVEYQFPLLGELFQAQAGAMTNLAGVAAALILSNEKLDALLTGEVQVDRRSMFNMILTWIHSTYTGKAYEDKKGREYVREIARDEMIDALKEKMWISENNRWRIVPEDKRNFQPPISTNDYVTSTFMLAKVLETFNEEWIELNQGDRFKRTGTFCQMFQKKMKEYKLISEKSTFLGDVLERTTKRSAESTRQSIRQRQRTDGNQEGDSEDEEEDSEGEGGGSGETVVPNRMPRKSTEFPVRYEASDGNTYTFTDQDRYNVSGTEKLQLKLAYVNKEFGKLGPTDKRNSDDESRSKYTQKLQTDFDEQFDTEKGDVAAIKRNFLKMKKEWREATNPLRSDRPRRGQ